MSYRIDRDTFGEIKVQSSKLWGPQTQRSIENFKIGEEKIPFEIIKAFAVLKKSAALANNEYNLLSKPKTDAIVMASNEILEGKLNDHFPLLVWQTGSGTQTHMNVNEVIANRGNQILEDQNINEKIHPNNDVNISQSSNCNFPTAIHIAAVTLIEDQLLPALTNIKQTLLKKSEEFKEIIKVGRTHLQDAVPITLGQEFSGWYKMIEKTESMITCSYKYMEELAFAGTATGTGLNTYKGFADNAVEKISKFTNKNFKPADNKFHALTSYDELVFTHGALTALAADLMKIANDIRWLASGPRSGIGEIILPSNEPGSSMMPGKINPTQCEAITMVSTQVMGNDNSISIAASQGNLEVNVFKPVIAYNFLQTVKLLATGINSFNHKCLIGIEPNLDVINTNLNNSLMTVTVLNPHIGYDNAAKIAQKAYEEGKTLKQSAIELKLLTEKEFDEIVDFKKMIAPRDFE